MDNKEKQIKEITSAIDRTQALYVKWSKMRGENYYISTVVYMLYSEKVTKQKELVEKCGMPKQTVGTIISELESKGYVTLEVDENDKRSKNVALTESGLKYAKSIVMPLLNCEKSVLNNMGNTNIKTLIKNLNLYSELLEKEMKNYSNENELLKKRDKN